MKMIDCFFRDVGFKSISYILLKCVGLLFLLLCLQKFCLEGSIVGGKPIRFDFLFLREKKSGKSSCFDRSGYHFKQNNFTHKSMQAFLIPCISHRQFFSVW